MANLECKSPVLEANTTLKVEKTSLKGTFDQIVDKVPTKAISIMLSQDREPNYVFNVEIFNGFLMVW